MNRRISLIVFTAAFTWGTVVLGADQINFERQDDQLTIQHGDNPLATYVFHDDEISRPYFCNVRSAGGEQVTRHHPPHEDDLGDHDTFHPGIWLAFGDINGNDYWRLKARVAHVEFVEAPRVEDGIGTFTVLNRYLSESGENSVCREVCRYEFRVIDGGYVLTHDSAFSGDREFAFGDQEEMGLGVRLATSIAENQGRGGLLTSSVGRTTAADVWGRQAEWCDYSGVVNGHEVGVTILAHPGNFRESWWHARDYGFVAGNPFGRSAFTRGEASRIVVAAGDELRLRFAVVIHDGRPGGGFDPGEVYGSYVSGEW